MNFNLYQSGYIDYNWFNNFKNEKLNQFEFSVFSKWLNINTTYKVLNDYLYFDNTTNDITKLTVKPMQYDKTINYLSVKASGEIKFWKFALDNTVLYQSVEQSNDIVNVPQIVTRNTLYFTGYVFKKRCYCKLVLLFNILLNIMLMIIILYWVSFMFKMNVKLVIFP